MQARPPLAGIAGASVTFPVGVCVRVSAAALWAPGPHGSSVVVLAPAHAS